MRKRLFILALAFLGLYMALARPFSPGTDQTIHDIFSDAGFDHVTLPAPVKHWGSLTYQTISLDPEGFSTIKDFQIFRSWTGSITALEIGEIALTGELQDNLSVHIAGWNKRHIAPALFTDFRNNPIPVHIKKAQIALLNDKLGGLTLNFALQLRPQGGNYEIEAKLNGAQKQLAYTANVNGLITALGNWQAAIEVEQAKCDLGPLRASRINGTITITGEGLETPDIVGDLEAGGINLFDLPWQNASLTLDGTLWQTRLILGAKATGGESLELGLTLGSLQAPARYAGSLHADTASALVSWLDRQKSLPFRVAPHQDAGQDSPIDIAFQGDAHSIGFSVERPAPLLPLSGTIKPIVATDTLEDIFTGKPFFLNLKNAKIQKEKTLAFDEKQGALKSIPEGTPLILDLSQNNMVKD